MEWLWDAAKVVGAVLQILGGLKVLSRYTKWKWDDIVFDKAADVVGKVKAFLPPPKEK